MLSSTATRVRHYENFPVASFVLPARYQRPVLLIYRFAREADDIADEGDVAAPVRLQRLDDFRTQLRAIEHGKRPETPWFRALGEIIREHRLPLQAFHDLLSAFSQDVIRARYENFGELLDYCRRSANPIGRILLTLYGALTRENEIWSDAICSALQLINFLQDIALDFRKGRVYIPADEMARYGVTTHHIASEIVDDAWRDLMHHQVTRARNMLLSGEPLGRALSGRSGLELRMIIAGGDKILDKILSVRCDIFRERPVLRWHDWPAMLLRGLMR